LNEVNLSPKEDDMVPFRKQDGALIWEYNHEILLVEPWGKDSARVRVTRNPVIRDDLPGCLLPRIRTVIQIEIRDDVAILRNGLLQVEVSAQGALRFINTRTGEEILRDLQPEVAFIGPSAREFKPVAGDLYHIEAWFAPYEDERLYGMGQQQHGRLNQKGCVIDLMQRNSKVHIPFLLSSRGYGMLWHHPGVGRLELGVNGTRWVAEAARQIDLWITVGDTPADILAHYVDATGHAPLLPEWAAGFWQCKLRYRTQDEILQVAREHKRRGLPMDVIVVDYFHWTMQGDWKFDPVCWPDPGAMVQELKDMGIKVMVSVWPTVNAMSENYTEMVARGYLVQAERGVEPQRHFVDNKPEGRVYLQFYDATHPGARHFLWDRCRENYYNYGIKVLWLDACEPEINPVDPENLRYYAGPGLEVTNIYPLMNQQAFYDGMKSEGEDEIVTLCRSAWAGSQRYGAALWSGDIASTFESLQRQVRAGLNAGLSGIPWWTTDIGGFHGGDPTTAYFRELIVRWFQYGVFCPLFRLHGNRIPFVDGSGAGNEVWSFGEPAYKIIKEILFLRERLRPYIMDQMQLAHINGTPPMRPLFFDFPGDKRCWMVEDEFMFGPDILVAPVLDQGATQREVYLPAGAAWTDAWTEENFVGGQVISADAPLERIPLYLRDGAELPIKAV
jgi:alpha-D-xyloside xylohydrolase